MGHALESFQGEINHEEQSEINLMRLTKAIKKYFGTPKELLYHYIPKTEGVRSTTAYNVLIFIHCTPATTNQHIADSVHCNNAAVKRSVIYLRRLGYIRLMPHQRYIKPFNTYKTEKTYIITPKGKTVLSKLLNY